MDGQPKEGPEPRKRGLSKVKLLIFSLIPVATLALAFEALAWATIDRRIEESVDEESGRQTYTLRIGHLPWSRESVTPLNALGFPDREFDGLGPKGDCFHVVFAGDSFVFGDGVDGDSSFVSLVRASLQGRPGCMRVFNIGERATTIEQQSARIRETWDVLEPDLVLLGQYQNDLIDLTKPGFAAYREPEEGDTDTRWSPIQGLMSVFRASSIRLISYHSVAFMIEHGIHRDELERWSILENPSDQEEADHLKSVYSELYHELVTDLETRGVPMGVIILPSKFDLLAGRSPEAGFFTELAESRGIPYLLGLPVLDAARSPYPFLLYDGHLNEQGNRVVADAVLPWLLEGPFASRLRPALKGPESPETDGS